MSGRCIIFCAGTIRICWGVQLSLSVFWLIGGHFFSLVVIFSSSLWGYGFIAVVLWGVF
jgi:hypothetical protein